jgi:hypothetical protein
MVKLVAFVPNAQSLSVLAELCQPIGVLRQEKPIGGPSRLWLCAPDATRVILKLTDHTVVFKFEVFELIAEPWAKEADLQFVQIGQVSGWDTIKCLFRFEWLRPAEPGELSISYEQVVGDRGRREDIPTTALCVAVSMVGLGFWSTRNAGTPIALILSDDDDPAAFRLLDKPAEMAVVLSDCVSVSIGAVKQWSDGSWEGIFCP